MINAEEHNTTAASGILRSEEKRRPGGWSPAGGIAFEPPGLMPAQNATRTPPLAVPVRLWSDIIMPSTAPNTDTLRLVR